MRPSPSIDGESAGRPLQRGVMQYCGGSWGRNRSHPGHLYISQRRRTRSDRRSRGYHHCLPLSPTSSPTRKTGEKGGFPFPGDG